MSVYIVAQLRFTNEQKYRQYQKKFADVFRQFSGELLAAEEQPKVLEGDWHHDKLVLMHFSNEEQARLFLTSPEYVEISLDRRAGAHSTALLVRGLDHERLPQSVN